MKIAGYDITKLEKTVIISSGAENGYPSKFMITVIRNPGHIVYQSVILNESQFVDDLKDIKRIHLDYNIISKLSLSRLNKTHYVPVIGRSLNKKLIILV